MRELHSNKVKLRSKIVRNDLCELTLEVFLKTENMNITSAITKIEGVNDVSLVQYLGAYEI